MSKENRKQKIKESLKNKNLVKIISGIQNYDKQKVLSVALAAEFGWASAVDICDDPDIIKSVRATVQLPVFVSSVDPLKLIASVAYGADVLELGNYESFYKEGRMFTPSEILETFQFVKKSVPQDILICVTVPSTLEIENQINLAKELVRLDVDMIQTEGFAQEVPESDRTDKTFTELLQVMSTLANTIEIKKYLKDVDVITASGVTPIAVPIVLASGASGIGVGTYINSLFTQSEMTERVKEIVSKANSFMTRNLEYLEIPALRK